MTRRKGFQAAEPSWCARCRYVLAGRSARLRAPAGDRGSSRGCKAREGAASCSSSRARMAGGGSWSLGGRGSRRTVLREGRAFRRAEGRISTGTAGACTVDSVYRGHNEKRGRHPWCKSCTAISVETAADAEPQREVAGGRDVRSSTRARNCVQCRPCRGDVRCSSCPPFASEMLGPRLHVKFPRPIATNANATPARYGRRPQGHPNIPDRGGALGQDMTGRQTQTPGK